jgi:hypothetical protein
MIPIDPREKLDPASRVNFTKLYTVEQNVKLCFIGSIDPKDEQQVASDYNRINNRFTLMSSGHIQAGTTASNSEFGPTIDREMAEVYVPLFLTQNTILSIYLEVL